MDYLQMAGVEYLTLTLVAQFSLFSPYKFVVVHSLLFALKLRYGRYDTELVYLTLVLIMYLTHSFEIYTQLLSTADLVLESL